MTTTSSEALRSPALESRLPKVGTTIFTVMSALAQQHGAVNLGQGFPDFDCDPRLLDVVTTAMRSGLNQYPPMAGVPSLREAIAAKLATLYGHAYDPEHEITVTAGATQGILTALLAVVHPGDEVIVLEPAYDSYAPNIALEAIDSDVIKTYVRNGLGIGIVAEMAVKDDLPGGDLVWRPAASWSRGRPARCSATSSHASPSSAAPTCATSSTASPCCCPSA